MKIRIISCRNKNYWYSGLIGYTFDVLGVDHATSDYVVLYGGQQYTVDFSDCELV